MTPDQIIQLRQLLKAMCKISNTEPRNTADVVYGDLAQKALALLPCETCNGTKRILGPDSASYVIGSQKTYIPCPDCQ